MNSIPKDLLYMDRHELLAEAIKMRELLQAVADDAAPNQAIEDIHTYINSLPK